MRFIHKISNHLKVYAKDKQESQDVKVYAKDKQES